MSKAMLEMKIKDPRLGFVTVTDAYVTNDLREATVFYTVLGDALEQQASAQALTPQKDCFGPRWENKRVCATRHR